MADPRLLNNRRTRWRYVFVATLGLFAAVQLVASFLDSALGSLRGYLLVSTGTDQQTIIAVQDGGPGAAAGLRPGDRMNLDALYPNRTTNYDPIVAFHRLPGETMTLPFVRGSRQMVATLTLASSWNRVYDVLTAFEELCILVVIGVGAWIVLARPSLMTWSFYAFLASNGVVGSAVAFSRLGYWAVFVDALLAQLLSAMFVFIIVFAARVPNNRATGWRHWLQLTAIPLYVITVCVDSYSMIAWSLLGVPARYAVLPVTIGTAIAVLVFGAAGFAFVLTYLSTRGSDRIRMGWVVPGGLLWVAVSVIVSTVAIPYSGYGEWLLAGLFILQTAGIIMVAYGVATSHIVDAAFFVSRTIVVGAIAGSIVVAFAVLDWLLTKKLEASRIGMVAEVGLAIALGFWLNGLHHRVDRIVDRLFFRKRYEAEQRLARAAHAVVHAPSVKVIREFLVDEPQGALDLASAALFEHQHPGTTWKRTNAIGWDADTLDELDDGDALVLHVQAEQTSLRTAEIRWHGEALPRGKARPVVAVPVMARRRVIAIALYGEHMNGANLDADEIRSIENLTDAAGAACDHVEAEELRVQLADATRQLDMLRSPRATAASD